MPVQLYTVEEAAQRLNTTPRFIRRLIAERRIAFTRLGRHVRIQADVLDEFITAGRVEPATRIPHPRQSDRGPKVQIR
jgi:excisionase family DNA binding protein